MAFFSVLGPDPLHLASGTELAGEVVRLRAENEQLRQAMASHAVIDQAIGALVVLGQIGAGDGLGVLRDVSQRTNTKLHAVAERVLDLARGGELSEPFLRELRSALTRLTATATG
ncbi:ANTAR domain-containing protein [Streptomyces sp. NPDC004082]|uniref:ANTAR domain-containing protein n=1 Tax=unclassified Streptomyces TaxID=2593676 RepID=UPI0033AB6A89